MASLVGLAPTRAGLKDRALGLLCIQRRWRLEGGVPDGFRPRTASFTGRYAAVTSQAPLKNGKSGTSAWSRTKLALLNRQAAHSVHSLVWEKKVVGTTGNAPACSCSQGRRLTFRLRPDVWEKWSRAGGSHSAVLVPEARVVAS